MYSSKYRLLTTLREDMRLQGIPDFFHFPADMSDTVAREMVGNAMSVDVLKCLFRELHKIFV